MNALGAQARARAALTYLAEPGDPALGALLDSCEPAEVLAAIKAARLPVAVSGSDDNPARQRALERALSPGVSACLTFLTTRPSRAPVATASGSSARVIPNGPPAWTSSARPARTHCGCAAAPI
jgi:hypothetical protein